MKKSKGFGTGKRALRAALESIEAADKAVESVRDHFDCEWGEGSHSDLDVALSVGVLRKLNEARDEINKVLEKFRGKALKTSFPRNLNGKTLIVPKSVTVKDLQKALVC